MAPERHASRASLASQSRRSSSFGSSFGARASHTWGRLSTTGKWLAAGGPSAWLRHRFPSVASRIPGEGSDQHWAEPVRKKVSAVKQQ